MGKIYLTESELEKFIKTIADTLKDEKKTKTLIQSILDKFKKKKSSSSTNTETEKKPEESDKDTSTINTGDKWMTITKQVIDKLEGGYWNPACGHQTKGMGKSTETMFGLDRYNGAIESTSDGRKFFKIIDDEKKKGMTNFCNEWKWLYRGGDKEEELKTLAAKVMKNSFDSNMVNFVKSKKLKNKILNNDALLFHMSYASWNGPWFFQQFANSLEKGLNKGLSDKELINLAINDRSKTVLYNKEKTANEIRSLA
jgi:hypothetical protein